MPYAYFEHDADFGVVGTGSTVEAAFEAAASAMFALTTDLARVEPRITAQIEFEEDDVELALVRWLNALLTEARMKGAVFARFRLAREGSRWRGVAEGEPWNERLERGVEVKGATLTSLSVREAAAGWEARCVVDV